MIPWSLCTGLIIEPFIHPKPGAVTRIRSHPDKSILEFLASNIVYCRILTKALENVESPDAGGCIVGNIFESLTRALDSRGLRTNTSLGSWLLHIPLSLAYTITLQASGVEPSVETLLDNARYIMRKSTACDTRGYYSILRYYAPSHLGRLKGEGPDVWSEDTRYPPLWDIIVKAGEGDIVHREITSLYPLSRKTSSMIEQEISRTEMCLEKAASKAFLKLMKETPDTLIARKYGVRTAYRVMALARLVDKNIIPISELDSYMRKNGINPGSLLDILATGITLFFYSKSTDPMTESFS